MRTPQFDNPPVVETVIGVQFPELVDFKTPHFGVFWDRIKDRYTGFEDKGRLAPTIERFPRPMLNLVPEIRMRSGGEPERVWYRAASESELIQLQPDRFLFNWRRQKGGPYPSYESNSQVFLREFDDFCRFCLDHGLEQPKPNLCEVSYINQLVPQHDENAIQLFGKAFYGLTWKRSDSFLPDPEAATFNRVFVVEGNKGRLYAEASIGVQLDDPKRPEFVHFKLTARVNHRSSEVQIGDSLRLAHDWVVCGFRSLTEPSIQKDRWRIVT